MKNIRGLSCYSVRDVSLRDKVGENVVLLGLANQWPSRTVRETNQTELS